MVQPPTSGQEVKCQEQPSCLGTPPKSFVSPHPSQCLVVGALVHQLRPSGTSTSTGIGIENIEGDILSNSSAILFAARLNPLNAVPL